MKKFILILCTLTFNALALSDDNILQLQTNQDPSYFDDGWVKIQRQHKETDINLDDDLLPVENTQFDIDTNPSLIQAAFEQENLLVNAYQSFNRPEFEPDDSFDITNYNLSKYGDQRHEFYDAKSNEEVSFIASQFEQDEVNKKTIEEGGALGIIILIIAISFDPMKIFCIWILYIIIPINPMILYIKSIYHEYNSLNLNYISIKLGFIFKCMFMPNFYYTTFLNRKSDCDISALDNDSIDKHSRQYKYVLYFLNIWYSIIFIGICIIPSYFSFLKFLKLFK